MELLAAIKAIENNLNTDGLIIYSDSEYLVKGYQKWLGGWKATNWKNGRLKNIDLWKKLDVVTPKKELVQFVWVRGHSGIEMNEFVDKLANAAIRN